MPDFLQKGSNWLEKKRARYAAQTVVYRRASSSVSVSATIGRSEFQIESGDGFYTTVQPRDYLILVADLTLDDQPIEPMAGDQIIEGDLSYRLVYEVMAPTASEPAWRYSDPYRQTFRVHTKYIGPLTA